MCAARIPRFFESARFSPSLASCVTHQPRVCSLAELVLPCPMHTPPRTFCSLRGAHSTQAFVLFGPLRMQADRKSVKTTKNSRQQSVLCVFVFQRSRSVLGSAGVYRPERSRSMHTHRRVFWRSRPHSTSTAPLLSLFGHTALI